MNFNHVAIQSVAATFAVAGSIFAAVFAWQQIEVSRTHNRLSVRPIVQTTVYLEGKSGRNGIYISNDGLGPAIIKNFSVKSGGVVASGFESDRWAEIIATTAANPTCFGTAWPKGEVTLKAGLEIPLVFVTRAEGAEICYAELVKLVGGNGIDISIEYESIYQEKQVITKSQKVSSRTFDTLYKKVSEK